MFDNSGKPKSQNGGNAKKSKSLAWIFPKNWIPLAKLLKFREKLYAITLAALMAASFFFWIGKIYYSLTVAFPKEGGNYIEGVIGDVKNINPLISQERGAEADLVKLFYSGLFRRDKEGKIVEDLAQSYDLSEDHAAYTIHLKRNVKWHDGEAFNSSDVCFTYTVLQDRAYNSPLRFSWQGVEVKCPDDNTVVITLKKPYFGFINNLVTGIIPKHIWQDVPPERFALSDYNLRPVGTGPYKFFDYQKDSGGRILSYELRSVPEYYLEKPLISKITFNFYENYDDIIKAYNGKEILAIGNIAPEEIKKIKSLKSTNIREILVPRFFYVYFNQNKNIPLTEKPVRKALALATDRGEMISKVQDNRGISAYSTFLPGMPGYKDDSERQEFNLEEAKKILEESGWKANGEGIREKNGKKLEFNLYTTDWPKLAQTADIIKSQWGKIEVKINVNILTVSDLQQNFIRPREYEILLLGQDVLFNFDPFPIWHSSQKKDPGLNMSMFDNKDADKLLEEAREDLNETSRSEKYEKFQKIIADEVPGVFLYSPYYIYPVSTRVKGIDLKSADFPSDRFADVFRWYIKTSRKLK
ncbi:MAG: hypothetical protein A3J63_01075 [Candidatus Moranbacteria bacterium RIFCSPHIGHO2_02_FULL_40_12b]|nr:MAG: hypothetical protein A3J63_01075 [Candidatus Moranbacteria bacterium RIFCSPHIGHO2_02_FULL_40_12b]